MTHPTPPKLLSWWPHGMFADPFGDYYLADEALAYTEAVKKQARLDALNKLHDMTSIAPMCKTVKECNELYQQAIRKLREGV